LARNCAYRGYDGSLRVGVNFPFERHLAST
jgi:hypothetical protein